MKIFRSFACAFKGIWRSIRSERHLRFHFFAAFCAGWLALRFQLTRGELAALLLTFGAVIGMELVNTAIEVLTDCIMPGYHPAAKAAKDIAAAAVLVVSLGAVAEAVVFFWRPEQWALLFEWFAEQPWRIVLAAGVLLLWAAFVWGFWNKPLQEYEKWMNEHRAN